MKMFSIPSGAEAFRQWDLGQRLAVADGSYRQVHFSNADTQQALVCEVFEEDGQYFVNVPNILLQQPHVLQAYGYAAAGNSGRTVWAQEIPVIPRQKPADYVYTETEVKSFEMLESRVEKLEENAVADEVIAEAVEGYLEENPVEIPVQSVNGKTGEVNLTAADVGALDESALQSAIETALTQAKQGGAFDGEDYVLTETDKTEIAQQAAQLVDVPTDAHINDLISDALGVIENGTY